jgi:hypothetical protein
VVLVALHDGLELSVELVEKEVSYPGHGYIVDFCAGWAYMFERWVKVPRGNVS